MGKRPHSIPSLLVFGLATAIHRINPRPKCAATGNVADFTTAVGLPRTDIKGHGDCVTMGFRRVDYVPSGRRGNDLIERQNAIFALLNRSEEGVPLCEILARMPLETTVHQVSRAFAALRKRRLAQSSGRGFPATWKQTHRIQSEMDPAPCWGSYWDPFTVAQSREEQRTRVGGSGELPTMCCQLQWWMFPLAHSRAAAGPRYIQKNTADGRHTVSNRCSTIHADRVWGKTLRVQLGEQYVTDFDNRRSVRFSKR